LNILQEEEIKQFPKHIYINTCIYLFYYFFLPYTNFRALQILPP
jgi:hypothetical protein